jgi:hypothetical protein
MNATAEQRVRSALEKLTGEEAPLATPIPETALKLLSQGPGLGHSQLNELLILLGFDRVTTSFFQFIVDETTGYSHESTIRTVLQLEEGIDSFRKIALLLYGNVKFAFKTLSRDTDALVSQVQLLGPADITRFTARHLPVRPVNLIPSDKTYYLGYIIERQLQDRLGKDPTDEAAKKELEIRKAIVEQGRQNHEAYLASDHLDVYVATSMRERHEFMMVSQLTSEIFTHPELTGLNLRWFDPTQAYCKDRIDKGLAEALMLRRAQCTIYFAQESDTLGKDSELASTLAQGKSVIAFVPEVSEGYAVKLLEQLKATYPEDSELTLLLKQIRLFDPGAAWTDRAVRNWIDDPASMDIATATARLQTKISSHYDQRARTLKEAHPLGIQVHLGSGVANGVLVVRTVPTCAKLVRQILTHTLEFDLDHVEGSTLLREKVSGCVFRVMTGDKMLTNAFWNFYLEPSE